MGRAGGNGQWSTSTHALGGGKKGERSTHGDCSMLSMVLKLKFIFEQASMTGGKVPADEGVLKVNRKVSGRARAMVEEESEVKFLRELCAIEGVEVWDPREVWLVEVES